jgi:colanic acid/amylovoran biosynthesis glycosyltransferase
LNLRKIGYLTTEFPGQTHIFLWREYNELLNLGVDAELISTRKPHPGIVSHSWSTRATANTRYIFPFQLSDLFCIARCLFIIKKSGFSQIWQIFSDTAELNLKQKLSLVLMLIASMKVAILAKQQGWSHIHSTTCGNAANIAMFASRIINITYSVSLLGPKLETYGPNQRNKWRFATFALFQSSKLLQDAEKTLAGFLPKLYCFAPVGVDASVMMRKDKYRPWSGLGRCYLYSCGRLNPIKGHEYVIAAVRQLRDEGYDVLLTIGGEDIDGGTGYRNNIEQCIREHQLDGKVTLLGAVSEEQNRDNLAKAHIYVMGSLDEAAGAVAAMEAMCMMLPVVMPNVGATSELIEHKKEGLLCQPKQSGQLTECIKQLMNDPNYSVQLGQAGREKVVKRFNHRISAGAIAAYLNQISND